MTDRIADGLSAILPAALNTNQLSKFIVICVAWSAFLFVVWVALGDSSDFHKTQFRRYRSVWIAFSLVILILVTTLDMYYVRVDDHVQALRGEAVLLASIISSDASDNKAQASLENLASQAIIDAQKLISITQDFSSTVSISDSTIWDLLEDVHQLEGLTSMAYRVTLDLVSESWGISETKGISFEPLLPIITELVTATQLIPQTLGALTSEPAASQLLLRRQLGAELLSQLKQAQLLVTNAKTTMLAGSVNLANLFTQVAILYAVFLLFPWILLFLFLFRNLDFQVNSKQQTLTILKQADSYMAKSKAAVSIQPRDPQAAKSKAANSGDNGPTLEDTIISQAFRNSEYVVSLLLLTTITAIMWHFVWFPLGWFGLAHRITQGVSVKELAVYLIDDASAFTFGFMGAYFFVILMLFRRYLAADLNPKPYVNATVRVMIVFVLCVVLSTLEWLLGGVRWIYPVAFLAGIVPMVALRGILRVVGNKVGLFKGLELFRGPLTDLDGVNIWGEERLMEEGVENIQNLATATLDELIVHTNYPPVQLLHWVDQALLYIQVRDPWRDCFHRAGIQTATDLCNADISQLATSVEPCVCQRVCKEDSQTLSTEGVKATIETMKKALSDVPNYIVIERFWQTIKGNLNGKQESQAPPPEDIRTSEAQ